MQPDDQMTHSGFEHVQLIMRIMGVWVNHQCEAEEISPGDVSDGFNLLMGLAEDALSDLQKHIEETKFLDKSVKIDLAA